MVDVLITFLEVMLLGALSLAALRCIDPLIRLSRRRRGVVASAVVPAQPPRSWSLTLLVDVDHEARIFRPSVQLRGSTLQFPPTLRLEVVDGWGVVRAACERPLPPSAIGTEVELPAFTAPDGAAAEDVLRWHWDVVLEDRRGEQARWREHPAPAGALNAEAELDLPSVAQV